MRGTALFLVLAAICFGGCISMEQAAKMISDATWVAVEKTVGEKLGPLEDKIVGGLKKRWDAGLEKVSLKTAEITAASAQKIMDHVNNVTGVDVAEWDTDGNGILSVSEILAGRRNENEKRENRGDAPLGLSDQFWLLLAIGGYTAGKSARRLILKLTGKTNGEAGDPPVKP